MKKPIRMAVAAGLAWAVIAAAAGSLLVANAAGSRGNGPELASVKASVATYHTTDNNYRQ